MRSHYTTDLDECSLSPVTYTARISLVLPGVACKIADKGHAGKGELLSTVTTQLIFMLIMADYRFADDQYAHSRTRLRL